MTKELSLHVLGISCGKDGPAQGNLSDAIRLHAYGSVAESSYLSKLWVDPDMEDAMIN